MPSQNPHRDWKTLTILLFVAAGIVLLCTLPTYSGLTGWLGKFQPDGSFDSLSQQEFSILEWILRAKALFLVLAGIFSVFNKTLVSTWLDSLGNFARNFSLRRELKTLRQSTFPRQDRAFLLGLAGITLFSLLIRLIQINRTVGYDEAYTFIHFASRSLRIIITDYSAPNNHIFHSLLVSLAYHIFGNHLWVLRLPALLAGVLTVPAVYMAGKAIYSRSAGLLAAAFVALSPMLVDYSGNARGYTLICLFANLILWLTGQLRNNPSFTKWVLLASFSILGFYTVPVMVYPVCGVYLWLLISWLVRDTPAETRGRFLAGFILTSLMTILTTLALYSPVLIFGSGLSSIISNEFVQSQSYSEFLQSVMARTPRVWAEWTFMVPGSVVFFTVAGFILLPGLEQRSFKHKIPVWLPMILAISILLFVQRVAPWPRVWLFLLVFYLLWSAAGWTAFTKIAFARLQWKFLQPLLIGATLLLVILGFVAYKTDPIFNAPEESLTRNAARFVASIITDEDTLVAVSPVSIQVGYYLTMEGIPFDRFYNKARREPIQHAIVILAERSKFPTLDRVVEFQLLQDALDVQKAELLYGYKRMRVYSVPALP